MIRKSIFLFLLAFFFNGCALSKKDDIEKSMVIIVPSYNNEKWYQKNLDSVFSQNYQNYRLVYINDASTDNTYSLVKDYIKKNNQEHKVTLIKNPTRQGSLANQYNAIHSCNDNDIIIILDGDDWLANPNVLKYINGIYKDNDVWLTYGHCRHYPSGALAQGRPMPDEVIKNSSFRTVFPMPFYHLRTFYAWLFKKIKKKDLLDSSGNFFAMSGDVATMMPMVEMAKNHFMFISEVLYIHNAANPLNDDKISRKKQHGTSVYIRQNQSKYKELD